MIKLLLKTRLRSILYGLVPRGKGDGAKKVSKGKAVLFATLYLYLLFTFTLLSVLMSISLGTVLIPSGASWLYFAVMSLVTLSVVFVLGVFETKSEIFEGRDNEMLLAMPIKPRDIVAYRIITVLIYNLVETAVMIIPATVVYAVYSGFEIRGIIGSLIIGLLVPFFATALSSAIGYLLSLLTKKLKSKTLFTVVLSLIFIFAYMIAYSEIISGFEDFIANLGNNAENIKQNYGILYFIGMASMLSPVPFLVVFLVSALSGATAYFLISKNYISFVTASRNTRKTVYRAKRHERKSALLSLVKKELLKFKSSAIYILNSSLGLIFEVILAAAAIANRNEVFAVLSELQLSPEACAPLFIGSLLLMGSMNMMSASALSLEGENLWILKSMPIDAKTVMWAKSLPHIIVAAVPTVIASVLMYIASASPVYYLPFFITVPLVAVVASSFFGLILNVAFPKFNYENEAQVVKQSLPVFLVMMTQAIFFIALLIGSIVLSFISPLLAAFMLLSVTAAAAFAVWLILFNVSARKYGKITV